MTRVVLDTNVFVAAAFRRESASAQIVRRVRDGELRLVWNDATRSETERILRKIPVVDESLLDGLYLPANRFDGETHADRFGDVVDPEDRKFAALAHAADAVLVSNDEHLLGAPLEGRVLVLTPSVFRRSM